MILKKETLRLNELLEKQETYRNRIFMYNGILVSYAAKHSNGKEEFVSEEDLFGYIVPINNERIGHHIVPLSTIVDGIDNYVAINNLD